MHFAPGCQTESGLALCVRGWLAERSGALQGDWDPGGGGEEMVSR